MNKKTIIGSLVLVGLILFCAFQSSFLDGLIILGEIVNIFGTVFVWVFKLIFSIPQVAEEIIKRVVTTLLILGLSTWWCVDNGLEQTYHPNHMLGQGTFYRQKWVLTLPPYI